MRSDSLADREAADAGQVDAAISAFTSGDLVKAESLLLGVIANTPAEYSNSVENAEGVSIKFWGLTAFLHYVTWRKAEGLQNAALDAIGNAYPRACFYMGCLCVQRKQFDRAIKFLDKGHSLEPTNPKFALEKAKALMLSGRKRESLMLFDQVTEIGPYVTGNDVATARRGRGFVLIEMGDLDGAEDAFKRSLELEPASELALNELQYIEHLRQGGAAAPVKTVSATGPDLSRCVLCGRSFEEGVAVSVNGMPVIVCKHCKGKITKKWWQFWK